MEIYKRLLTGFVYGAVLLLSVYGGYFTFTFLLLLFYILTLSEFFRITEQKESALNYLLSSFFCFLFFYKENMLDLVFLSLVILMDIFLIYKLLAKKSYPKNKWMNLLFAFFYIGGGFVFLSRVPSIGLEFDKGVAIACLSFVWINDSFAYFIGKIFGRRKLFSSVSPKKTVEGFLGGVFFVVLFSIVFSKLIFHKSLSLYLSLGLVVVVVATLGDLVQSKFKRSFGVKDSGKLLPGHGGFYDRLDSLILLSPFVFLVLKTYEYVS